MSDGEEWVPWTAEQIAKMNAENAANQARLNAEYAQRKAAGTPHTLHVYARSISCVGCRFVLAWTWTEGDKVEQTGSLNGLFKQLSAHQRISRGHLLRFKETVRPVVVLE